MVASATSQLARIAATQQDCKVTMTQSQSARHIRQSSLFPQGHRGGDLRGAGAGRHRQDLHRLEGGHRRGGERAAPQEGAASAAQAAGAEGHRAVEGRARHRRQEEATQDAQGR